MMSLVKSSSRKQRVLNALRELEQSKGADTRATTTRRFTRTLHSRAPLYRFQEIFGAIKSGKFPNRTQLAQSIEVTTKTIQRDLDYMRYQLGLPIEFNYVHGGYNFTRPVTDLPLFHLNEAELVSLFVAQKALEAYKGTVFEQPLRNGFQKLQAASNAGDNKAISVTWEELDRAISFRQFNGSLPDLQTFDTVTAAIREQRTIRFEYRKLRATRHENRSIEPWHLACVSGQWYLFGHDLKRDATRVFVLARMRNAEKNANRFELPEAVSELFKNSFQIWQTENAQIHEIRLRFDSFAAQLVRERTWHTSQSIQELAVGELELSLRVNAIDEILPWVLSWGSHCVILSPQILRRRVQEEIVEMLGSKR
jgi:predicted DNA-binding transcriptional regulator YafY